VSLSEVSHKARVIVEVDTLPVRRPSPVASLSI
jgi:hypothetical protein